MELSFRLGEYERDFQPRLTITRNRDGILVMKTARHDPKEVEQIGNYRLRWHWDWGHADFIVLSSTELLELKRHREPLYWYFKTEDDASRAMRQLRRWLGPTDALESRVDCSQWRSLTKFEEERFQFLGFVKSERHIPMDAVVTLRLAVIAEVAVLPVASARKLESPRLLKILTSLKRLAAQAVGCQPEALEDPDACVAFNNTDLACEPLGQCAAGLSTRQIAGIHNGRDPLVLEGQLCSPIVWIAVILNDQRLDDSGNLVMHPGSHMSMADVVAKNGRDYYKFSEAHPLSDEVRETAFPVTDCEPPEAVHAAEGSVVVVHGAMMFGHLANRLDGEEGSILYIPFYGAKKVQEEDLESAQRPEVEEADKAVEDTYVVVRY